MNHAAESARAGEVPAPPRGGVRRRLCACMLTWCMGQYERLVEPHKRALLSDLEGDVVEIGAGAGANLPLLAASAGQIRYTAVEPNPYLHDSLRERAREARVPMELVRAPIGTGADALPAASADVVICTLVLCSVPDAAAAVAEIGRMLRPGGRFIFIEHVAAPPRTWLRGVQRAVRPVWRFLGDGCEPDRETEGTIRHAGGIDGGVFVDVQVSHFRVPVPVVSPHIAGVARRGA